MDPTTPPAVQPWASYLTSLNLSFHLCKTGIIIAKIKVRVVEEALRKALEHHASKTRKTPRPVILVNFYEE